MVGMTDMPQMVALLNGCGGGAAALISTVEFANFMTAKAAGQPVDALGFGATMFGGVIGSLSFWGSLVAFAKLQRRHRRRRSPRRSRRSLTLVRVPRR